MKPGYKMEKLPLLVHEKSQCLYFNWEEYKGGDGQVFYLNKQAIETILELFEEDLNEKEYNERNEFISFRFVDNHIELLDDYETDGLEDRVPAYFNQPKTGWTIQRIIRYLVIISIMVAVILIMVRGANFFEHGI